MNKREKILTAIVGSLLLLMVIGIAVRQVNNAIGEKRRDVARLQEEKRQKELVVQQSQRDEEQMEVYNNRAMPADLGPAQTLYKTWLMDCAKEVGFKDRLVNPTTARSSGSDVYDAFAFTVSGQGDLKQIIKFLHKFYSVDCLHRVYHFSAKRVSGSKQHDLNISVEALSLPTATNTDQLPDGQSDRLSHGDLDAYLDTILSRNLSRPPNINAPTMDSIENKTVHIDRPVEFSVGAKDPDKLDELTYEIDGLPDASIDEKTGRFEWNPEKPGKYEVVFTVKDDRWPPKSDSQTIEFEVTEAPPEPEKPVEKPSFELAKFAFVTAITEVSGRRQTWINLRTEGKVLKLHEGDSFGIGEVEVTVKRIEERAVELEAKILEKRLSVSLGDNLSEGSELPAEEISLQ